MFYSIILNQFYHLQHMTKYEFSDCSVKIFQKSVSGHMAYKGSFYAFNVGHMVYKINSVS